MQVVDHLAISPEEAASTAIAATVVRAGWRPKQLAIDPIFVEGVRLLMRSPSADSGSDLDLVLRFAAIVADAVGSLGDNEYGLAASLLTGLDRSTQNQLRMHRIAAAAAAMSLKDDYFRTRYQPDIIADLGAEIYRLTAFEDRA